MPTKLEEACLMLQLSLGASIGRAFGGDEPLQRRMAWLGSELERLAGEAYRLADEAGDNTESNPDPCREPIPGFPPKDES